MSAKERKKLSILLQHSPFIDDVFDFVASFSHQILRKRDWSLGTIQKIICTITSTIAMKMTEIYIIYMF